MSLKAQLSKAAKKPKAIDVALGVPEVQHIRIVKILHPSASVRAASPQAKWCVVIAVPVGGGRSTSYTGMFPGVVEGKEYLVIATAEEHEKYGLQYRATPLPSLPKPLLDVLVKLPLTPGQIAEACRTLAAYDTEYLERFKDALEANPYLLHTRCALRFDTVDPIARDVFKVSSYDPRRLEAAAHGLLQRAAINDGACYMPEVELLAELRSTLLAGVGNYAARIEQLRAHIRDGRVNSSALQVVRRMPTQEVIYTRALRDAEEFAAHELRDRLTLHVDASRAKRFDTLFPAYLRALPSEQMLTVQQQEAVRMVCTQSVGVITGGPGTGKTHSLRSALDMLERLQVPYALTAPTGKAARRMAEVTGRPATTLHSLLKIPVGGSFSSSMLHDALTGVRVLVCDESSMLDITMLAFLLARTPDIALFFVGDVDQLPPVGPGQVFTDLIASGIIKTVRLQRLFRQSQESWVCANAPLVLKGDALDLVDANDRGFLFYDQAGAPIERIPETVEHVLQELLKSGLPVEQLLAETVILTPQKNTDAGAHALNRVAQRVLNPKSQMRNAKFAAVTRDNVTHRLYEGDRVMQVVNNYKLGPSGVMNGMLGTVVAIDDQRVIVNFDAPDTDPVVAHYDRFDRNQLTLGYALTVHKSQGSEWRTVLFVVTPEHTNLGRRLFYTAITRTKNRLLIIGNVEGVQHALSNLNDSKPRRTLLRARIQGRVFAEV
jgi:exodeoxyribonuclease V alpha subunit